MKHYAEAGLILVSLLLSCTGAGALGSSHVRSAGAHETAPAPAPEAVATFPGESKSNGKGLAATPEEVPAAPFHNLLESAGDVAKDAELRRGAEFYTEGAHVDADVPVNQQHELDSIFTRDPSIFGHCLLVRDYAEPFRVGSSIMKQPAHFYHQGRHLRANRKQSEQDSNEDDAEDAEGEDQEKLPNALLRPRGAVSDRDFADDDPDPDDKNIGAEFSLDAFAYLQSVAGEVAVVRNGVIAKWSSKRKVPIAGYLCTSNSGDQSGPVLYTLPTPCVPTVLDDDGTAYEPPKDGTSSAPAPAPAVPTGLVNATGSDDDDEEITDDEDRVEEPTAPPSASFMQKAKQHKQRRRVDDDTGDHYHVWVGHSKLKFANRKKANRFCHALARKIAEDPGDTVWDDSLMSKEMKERLLAKVNPSVSSFVQQVRQTPEKDWTLGTKSVLVVVMDWAVGDVSKAPNSKQTLTPHHYETKIFPRVQEAFKEMSYGQFDISVTVVPQVVRFTRQRSRYTAGGYPFPGLYNGAKDSLQGHATLGAQYSFDNYDLVYVISPQQAPTGTKGVAWVGAKGAMCNGCEELSENFQVMVAVHELGHNLGLSHASSRSLEYGNVFDWMGNYPDVEGLSYGVGYKLRLSWIPQASVYTVTDAQLDSLNDEFLLKPFDKTVAPGQGDLVGVQVSLSDAPRDVFIGYRSTAGGNAGVYITLQDKDSPNSELVDCACHSPSQQDARLRPGWTYLDPTSSFVVYLASVDDSVATVRIYKAPSSDAEIAKIRARSTFTDGSWKCPRTCTDSDLLVSSFDGCGPLAQGGYCNGGAITMGGTKYSISDDLCPNSCDKCQEVLSGSTLVEGGCQDRDIKISGHTCAEAARMGYCTYSTNLGLIGTDICPASCGNCPPRPAASNEAATFKDPTPAARHGASGSSGAPISNQEEAAAEEQEAEREDEASDQESDAESGDSSSDNQDYSCTDDPHWTDADGDGCAVYRQYIEEGRMQKEEACEYGEGLGKIYCRQTCNTCQAEALRETCADKQCIVKWYEEIGQCYECFAYATHCDEDFFKADCPATCGLCKSDTLKIGASAPAETVATTIATTTTTTTTPAATMPPKCEDAPCITAWLETHGECFKCPDFAADFCGKDTLFMESCPRTCKMCVPGEELECQDDFREHVCKRFKGFGWCAVAHVQEHCKSTCGVCSQLAGARGLPTNVTDILKSSARRSLRSWTVALSATLVATVLSCLW